MSVREVSAVLELGAEMPELVGQIDVKRRPNWQATLLVALLLADRFRPRRGYVDETVEQITSCVPVGDARPILKALHELDVWTVSRRGGNGQGTRRVPGRRLTALLAGPDHRGADPAEMGPVDNHDQRGVSPAQTSPDHRGVDDRSPWGDAPITVGCTGDHRGVHPTTPPSIPHQPPSPDDALERVIATAAGLVAEQRERNGWGPAQGGALAKIRRELDSSAARRWLDLGASEYNAAQALAARLTDGPTARSPYIPSAAGAA